MNGGLGNDLFVGSDGDDLINGGDGNDIALMGAGDDTFVWNPGDDNDTLEGQDGFDTMLFNGSQFAEQITMSANGERATFFRDIANVTDGPQRHGGRSTSTRSAAPTRSSINDMSGTDVIEVNINLGRLRRARRRRSRHHHHQRHERRRCGVVVGDNGSVSVLGLATQINITGFEATTIASSSIAWPAMT